MNVPHLWWRSGGKPNFTTGLSMWERKMKMLKPPSLHLETLKFIGELYDLSMPLIETAKPKQCNLVQSSNVTSLCAGKHRQAFTCPAQVLQIPLSLSGWGTEMQMKVVALSNIFYTPLLAKPLLQDSCFSNQMLHHQTVQYFNTFLVCSF